MTFNFKLQTFVSVPHLYILMNNILMSSRAFIMWLLARFNVQLRIELLRKETTLNNIYELHCLEIKTARHCKRQLKKDKHKWQENINNESFAEKQNRLTNTRERREHTKRVDDVKKD